MNKDLLREEIARAIESVHGYMGDPARVMADRILAIPAIADGLELRARQNANPIAPSR